MTSEQTVRQLCEAKAKELWAGFDENERAGVGFGMFPFGKMTDAEKEGHDGRLLAVALMSCAEAEGGMRA